MSDDRPMRRRILAVAVAGVLALGALGYGITTALTRASDEAQRADSAAQGIQDACEQVRLLGGSCVVDPDEYRGETGPAGPPGPAGRGIASARCTSGEWLITWTDGTADYAGPCTGSRGPAGQDGTDGEDGQPGVDGVPGEPGPSGPTGPAGPSGTDGDDGRGIADAQCDPVTGRWVITYSDGSTDDDAGPCRVL